MALIGTFKKVGTGFQGDIATLNVSASGVRIVPETKRSSEAAPHYRVFAGRAEIGAAWDEISKSTAREYISVKLDDPSFTTPLFAKLFQDEGGETHSLIWTRDRPQAAND